VNSRGGERVTAPARIGSLLRKQRLKVATYLRDLAQQLETGDRTADAVVIILSDGDIHTPFWLGHREWALLTRATAAISEERSRQSGWGCSPEENAERRARWRQQEYERQEAYNRSHPFGCICGRRCKSQPGLNRHITIERGRQWPSGDHGPELEVSHKPVLSLVPIEREGGA